jgi:hypothetical protein
MKDFFSTSLGCVFGVFFLGFGLLQIGAGWAGIEHHWGWGWGLVLPRWRFALRFQ